MEIDEKKEVCTKLILSPTEENPEYNEHNGDKKIEVIVVATRRNMTRFLSHLLNTGKYLSEVETGLEC